MIYTIRIYIPTLHDLHRKQMEFFNACYKQYLVQEDKAFLRYGRWFWKVLFRITKHCGSKISGHSGVSSSSHLWLWKTTPKYYICTVCGKRLKRTDKTGNNAHYYYLAREARAKDMDQLNKSLRTATNAAERTAVRKAISKINSEGGDRYKAGLREDLVKASREGDNQRIKEIHENLDGDRKYMNE